MGFHGRRDATHLLDLGVIWLDTENQACSAKMRSANKQGNQSGEAAYDSLSSEQKEKGEDMEALHTFRTIMESQLHQGHIMSALEIEINSLMESQEKLQEWIKTMPDGDVEIEALIENYNSRIAVLLNKELLADMTSKNLDLTEQQFTDLTKELHEQLESLNTDEPSTIWSSENKSHNPQIWAHEELDKLVETLSKRQIQLDKFILQA